MISSIQLELVSEFLSDPECTQIRESIRTFAHLNDFAPCLKFLDGLRYSSGCLLYETPQFLAREPLFTTVTQQQQYLLLGRAIGSLHHALVAEPPDRRDLILKDFPNRSRNFSSIAGPKNT